MATDPTKAVGAQVIYADGTAHRIFDCFALAGTDATFAGVFNSTLGGVAALAGLTVTT